MILKKKIDCIKRAISLLLLLTWLDCIKISKIFRPPFFPKSSIDFNHQPNLTSTEKQQPIESKACIACTIDDSYRWLNVTTTHEHIPSSGRIWQSSSSIARTTRNSRPFIIFRCRFLMVMSLIIRRGNCAIVLNTFEFIAARIMREIREMVSYRFHGRWNVA